ncbi:GntR family transcriptional regulator [Actinobacteria bacterium YIM 96077]|uniref:GntR family transcriptional regulator n=1 Tax=Phytoactinopolyspora halophila TaxID=1981511 RepID=A0A329QN41_9ACTN|nr:GntR family transcriptional regulator [Phytoactinopolyspora halophila]AYY12297.1 GntR family transcriptional regulator [Actinobacteria bacterium YIM 96077]RAW13785.1 GntR family transcriptional regulator [Phytoactinopolyspora halophila]
MYDASLTERRTAHEFVRDTLRRAVLRGTLAGGTRLVQSEIASELGVSTTPVREALRDLATEGLVDLDAHRGATVHQLELGEVREIYSLRQLLEPEAMRKAAGTLDEKVWERADDVRRHMDGETDNGLWADLNREFHGILVAGLAMPRLCSILHNLQDGAAPYVGLVLQNTVELRSQANREHAALMDALRSRDGERAAAITVDHLAHTVEALQFAHDQLTATAPEGRRGGGQEGEPTEGRDA